MHPEGSFGGSEGVWGILRGFGGSSLSLGDLGEFWGEVFVALSVFWVVLWGLGVPKRGLAGFGGVLEFSKRRNCPGTAGASSSVAPPCIETAVLQAQAAQ